MRIEDGVFQQAFRTEPIIHPNYKMKVSREVVKLVNFITATRRTDKKEFYGRRYVKIETDPTTE